MHIQARRSAGLWLLGAGLVFSLITNTSAATNGGALTFSNTPLLVPDGDSEPAISIGPNDTMAITGLSWIFYGTNLWTGPVGSTPTFRGMVDAGLQQQGRQVLGGNDADVDLGSTGTLHASTLLFIYSPVFAGKDQWGVSAIACPGGASASLDLGNCR